MADILTLKNDFLQLSINKTGAELYGIKLLSNGNNYMWNADPKIWAAYSPVLFPIIGNLKNGTYQLNGKKYSLPKHGFVRNNTNIGVVSSTENSLTLMLRYNEKTLEQFPFEFEFLISWSLMENKIFIDHEVRNLSGQKMYFSLGAHPAFKCPVLEGEMYYDYYLEFDQFETAYTYPILADGLMGEKTDLILNNGRVIDLNYHLFDKDALVFKNLKSSRVSLCSKISGKRVEVNFEGFDYLGIWAKPNANFVCIEPWMGIADGIDSDGNFERKEGILKLNAHDTFKAGYSIEVF